ncbi:MAG: hypothetical protein R2795_14110 [Saprospiraceae bacterium]
MKPSADGATVIIRRNQCLISGFAKGKMVSAIKVAASFLDALQIAFDTRINRR